MHKKFEINRTKITGGCQTGRKVVHHDSKSDLPLIHGKNEKMKYKLQSKNKSFAKFFSLEIFICHC